jgi:hypothetical protein
LSQSQQVVSSDKPQKQKKDRSNIVLFSEATLQKIEEFYQSKSKLTEIIQDKDAYYSLEFKKEKGKVFA